MIDTKLIEMALRDKEFLDSIPHNLQKEAEKICGTCGSSRNAKKELFRKIQDQCAQQLNTYKLKLKMEKKGLDS